MPKTAQLMTFWGNLVSSCSWPRAPLPVSNSPMTAEMKPVTACTRGHHFKLYTCNLLYDRHMCLTLHAEKCCQEKCYNVLAVLPTQISLLRVKALCSGLTSLESSYSTYSTANNAHNSVSNTRFRYDDLAYSHRYMYLVNQTSKNCV